MMMMMMMNASLLGPNYWRQARLAPLWLMGESSFFFVARDTSSTNVRVMVGERSTFAQIPWWEVGTALASDNYFLVLVLKLNGPLILCILNVLIIINCSTGNILRFLLCWSCICRDVRDSGGTCSAYAVPSHKGTRQNIDVDLRLKCRKNTSFSRCGRDRWEALRTVCTVNWIFNSNRKGKRWIKVWFIKQLGQFCGVFFRV